MRSFESGKRPRQSGHRPSNRGAQRGQMWRRHRAQMLEPSSTCAELAHGVASMASTAPRARRLAGWPRGGRRGDDVGAAPSTPSPRSRGPGLTLLSLRPSTRPRAPWNLTSTRVADGPRLEAHRAFRLVLQIPGAGGVADVGLDRRAEGGAVERGGRLEGRERARDAVVALGRPRDAVVALGRRGLVTLVVRRRGRRVVSRGVVGRPEVQRGPAQRRHRSIQGVVKRSVRRSRSINNYLQVPERILIIGAAGAFFRGSLVTGVTAGVGRAERGAKPRVRLVSPGLQSIVSLLARDA